MKILEISITSLGQSQQHSADVPVKLGKLEYRMIDSKYIIIDKIEDKSVTITIFDKNNLPETNFVLIENKESEFSYAIGINYITYTFILKDEKLSLKNLSKSVGK